VATAETRRIGSRQRLNTLLIRVQSERVFETLSS
jgi:hypothetical protein